MSERPNDPFETAVAELRERWVDVPEPNRLKIVNRRLDELAESAFDGEKPKFVKKGEEVGVWQEALGREKEELEKKLGTNSERSFHQGRKRPGSLNTLAEEIKRDADEQGFSTESERNAYIERMLAENDESLAENMPDNQGYGSRNMVAKEKQEVLKEIQFDPEGFLREAVIHLFKNPGDYEYVIALRHVANTDYFTDRQKTFLKNIQPITQAAERMKPIGKLEEGLRNIGHPEPEFLTGWLEVSVPIRITAGGRTFITSTGTV